MPCKKLVFKVINNLLPGSVKVTGDLIINHIFFFLNLFFRKYRIEENVAEKFDGTAVVFRQERSVYTSLLFGGVGVHIASYIIHPAEDMKSLPFGGAFKNYMLNEMCNAVFVILLIARTCVDHDAAM